MMKPIYNHVTGLIDPPEKIDPPKVLIIEGLHPLYDKRVRELVDFSIYLDISDDIKFAWKIQRDMAERGHSLASIKASIDARKPDFTKFIEPQRCAQAANAAAGAPSLALSFLPSFLFPSCLSADQSQCLPARLPAAHPPTHADTQGPCGCGDPGAAHAAGA